MRHLRWWAREIALLALVALFGLLIGPGLGYLLGSH